MLRYPIRSLGYPQLRASSRPRNPDAPEAFADTLYDTQEYVDNTTLTLRFFAAQQADQTLSNIGAGSQLQAGEFFVIENIMVQAWAEAGYVTTAAGGIAGTINDMGLLFFLSRPILQLTMNNKPYGPWPVTECLGSPGGISGQGWGTFTAEESLQAAWVTGYGKYIGGSVVIPPLTGFRVDIDWNAVADLTDDYFIRVNLVGTRYREVV